MNEAWKWDSNSDWSLTDYNDYNKKMKPPYRAPAVVIDDKSIFGNDIEETLKALEKYNIQNQDGDIEDSGYIANVRFDVDAYLQNLTLAELEELNQKVRQRISTKFAEKKK